MTGFYWLASYPKSGNTWLRLLLESLAMRRAPEMSAHVPFIPIASDRAALDAALCIDSSDLTADELANLRPRWYDDEMRTATAPLLRKVHDAWTRTPAGAPLFPTAATLGIVYIARDPRDVVVSMARHDPSRLDAAIAALNDPARTLAGTAARGYAQLPQRLLDWSGHVESWLDRSACASLLVRYEDLSVDTGETLKRVADYIGQEAPAEALVDAVAHCRFEQLQQREQRAGFIERSGEAPFFQRGVAGIWREMLSSSQVDAVISRHRAVMERLGYI